MTKVVIFVPGTMGNELYYRKGKAREKVWPGDLDDLITKYSPDKARKLRSIKLEVGEIIEELYFVGIYRQLIQDLRTLGYTKDNKRLYPCPYDWRLPLQKTTDALADQVALAHADHGNNVEISLVTHSQGGLMARFFLETGRFDQTSGFSNVKQLIMMGVPHYGLHEMLALARGETGKLWLDKQQVRDMLNTDGLSFAYLMLPNPVTQKTWHDSASQAWASWNLMEPANALKVGLTSKDNLDDAIEYQQIMSQASPNQGAVRYFSFVGTDKETFSGALVDTGNAGANTYDVDDFDRPDGGDGMVPIWSAWLPGHQGLAVGGKHGTLFKDRMVRKSLAHLLGAGGNRQALLNDLADGFDFHIDELVYDPGSIMHIRLKFETPMDPGALRLILEERQARDQEAGDDFIFKPVEIQEIEYPGVKTQHWCFGLAAPDVPGVYRWTAELFGVAIESEEFFVQDKSDKQD